MTSDLVLAEVHLLRESPDVRHQQREPLTSRGGGLPGDRTGIAQDRYERLFVNYLNSPLLTFLVQIDSIL